MNIAIKINSGPFIYMLSGSVTADKADSFDGRMIADSIHGRDRTVNDV